MAKYQRTKADRQEDKDEKHSSATKRHQSPYDQLKAPGEDTVPVLDTPFRPRVEEHTALLAGAHSAEQRASLVLQLQKTYGNTYVQRLLNSKVVQAKLTVNPPDDEYEREADRVAEVVTQKTTSQIQRQEEGEEEEEELMPKPVSEIQRQEEEEEEEEEELMTRSVGSPSITVSEDLEARINTARGGGQPLTDSVRTSLEPQFERDFSEVRIHTDTEADKLSSQLGAEAFTTGKDVFFREGAYQPASSSGQGLIAHELTHVVQQEAAPALQRQEEETQSKLAQTVEIGELSRHHGKGDIQRHILLNGEKCEFTDEQEERITMKLFEKGLGQGYQNIMESEDIHITADGISKDELADKIVNGDYDDVLRRAQAAVVAEVEAERVRAGDLTEGQTREVAAGGTIGYTALSAGCMAITVFFRGGGGAGLHYALNMDNARQWWQLRALVGGKDIEKVQLETDVGLTTGGQGWWVKYKGGAPDTADIPRSRGWLQTWYKTELEGQSEDNMKTILNRKGWWCSIGRVQDWFAATFGYKANLEPTTDPAPKQL